MKMKDIDKSERPREKLLLQGANHLSDAELLAVLLRTGVRGASAVELAQQLLHQLNGLRGVLNGDACDLKGVHGLGNAKVAMLLAINELGRRYLRQTLTKTGPLNDPQQASDYLMQQIRDAPRETFAVIYLDNRHCVLHYEELFYGTINAASVYPREVVKHVLKHNAAAVIVAHNHPSGVAEPSQADQLITKRLIDALNLIDVNLLDHLIVGDGGCVSMKKRGLC